MRARVPAERGARRECVRAAARRTARAARPPAERSDAVRVRGARPQGALAADAHVEALPAALATAGGRRRRLEALRHSRRQPQDADEGIEPAAAAPPPDEAARPMLTPPVLIVLSPGADPSQELQDAAAELLGPSRYHQVAMGQGQAELAVKLLRECAQSGA